MDFIRRILRRSAKPNSPPQGDGGPAGDERITRWRVALDAYGFPFGVVPYDGAMEAFEAELWIGEQEGFTPLFVVSGLWCPVTSSASKRMGMAKRHLADGITAQEGQAFLASRLEAMPRYLALDPETPDPAMFDALRAIEIPPLADGLALLKHYNAASQVMEPVPEVAIMRVPTSEPQAIPLYLDWGGWNAVPQSHELAAVARYWQDTHGARLVAVSADQLEFQVARKPATHGEAVALLKEHYAFASENWEFDQDMLEGAAAELRLRDSRTFWWD
jgi:hypothetical protein